ncbi:hypothetical protein Ae168Ps1_3562 [Pseudonocardia sp. Ae168_Ps1]|nr:hypothetical protein Ae150APs1_3540 [Pseudonocardia sp. Ae150A_Ps1]OLL81156.1 hypothetical protein Ae168Ps1_3562 [Pseudonocardia sp. Ae168_Ps1]OLL84729.1 hypothetical protein Ae263Ps1_1784c [Pseudonocardia sp. Ae263_Ps1]
MTGRCGAVVSTAASSTGPELTGPGCTGSAGAPSGRATDHAVEPGRTATEGPAVSAASDTDRSCLRTLATTRSGPRTTTDSASNPPCGSATVCSTCRSGPASRTSPSTPPEPGDSASPIRTSSACAAPRTSSRWSCSAARPLPNRPAAVSGPQTSSTMPLSTSISAADRILGSPRSGPSTAARPSVRTATACR